jgi:hypothetical protein
LFFIPLLLSLVLADAGPVPAVGENGGENVSQSTTLEVPFLPQTEALCGGAAAAMLFRYWGDRHADVQQFEPLVDRRAGGIADDVLERAIRERAWRVTRIAGTVSVIRSHLQAGQPLMLLLEDRPHRYHFVVVVAADDEAVYVHDPAWGPARRLTLAQLERAWKVTNFWTLLVLPDPDRQLSPATPSTTASPSTSPAMAPSTPPAEAPATAPATSLSPLSAGAEAGADAGSTTTECDRLIDTALDDLAVKGLAAADEILGAMRSRCPASSRPLAELAAVRFSQQRTAEAVTLAEQAVGLNRADTYAWDVLGSSRFIENDLAGALSAWNHAGKPTLDLVRIEGLTRTRYALIAQTLRLAPNTQLTADDYRRAERRLHQLPDRLASRMSYRPEADGYATVDVAIVERPTRPKGLVPWLAAGTKTLIDRELTVAIPGGTGQGEVWSGSWRWWHDRPRVAFAFAAPRVGRLPGVWQVDGSWEAQTYALDGATVRDTRTHAGVSLGDWLTHNLRYQLVAGLDGWDDSNRAVSFGATLERRVFADRLSFTAVGGNWISVTGDPAFRSGSIALQVRTSTEPAGLVALGRAQFEAASIASPRALWSGAGEGRARPGLLRAHPLLEDNIIAGPVFGRRVYSLNAEAQRWFERPVLIRLAAALFVDAAGATARLSGTGGRASQIDAGGGLRVRLPGGEGTLRVDYARGLRDGADAVTVGWQLPW